MWTRSVDFIRVDVIKLNRTKAKLQLGVSAGVGKSKITLLGPRLPLVPPALNALCRKKD